jgi:hypothetical protein
MVKKIWAGGALGLLIAGTAQAQQSPGVIVQPGKPIEIRVAPATAPAPPVSITLASRHGHATPHRLGCCHTGGGNIDVSQPSSDTVVITMSGVAVAASTALCSGSAGMDFDLSQDFEISFDKPDLKAAKVTVEARAIGLLRSHSGGGVAELTHGQVSIGRQNGDVVSLAMPDHSAADGENLSINDHVGPVSAPISAGKFTLCQTVHFLASNPKCLLPCKASSAEFAPDPALDPLWISYWEPFHGASKKDFGFQITLKVAADGESTESEPKKQPEIIPVEPKRVGPNTTPTSWSPVERIPFEPRRVGWQR